MPQTSNGVSEDTAVVQKPALGLVEFVALMATMTSLVALSIDAMLPALIQIGESLQVAEAHQTHLIVTVFFFRHGTGSNVLWAFFR